MEQIAPFLPFIVMIIVEAVPQIFGYLQPSDGLVTMAGDGGANFIIVMQLILGALLVFFMDELISKWGIGSGIFVSFPEADRACSWCFSVSGIVDVWAPLEVWLFDKCRRAVCLLSYRLAHSEVHHPPAKWCAVV